MGLSTSTITLPVIEESLVLTAVTVTEFGFGSAAGAEYKPELVIVPVVALPPAVLPTDQVTSLFGAPETVAENDWEPPMRTLAPLGVIATPEFEPPSDPPRDPPDDPLLLLVVVPQPAEIAMAADAQRISANLDARVWERFVVALLISGRKSCSACNSLWLAEVRVAGF